jgi:nucleotide-binding universal stress UspA family protein
MDGHGVTEACRQLSAYRVIAAGTDFSPCAGVAIGQAMRLADSRREGTGRVRVVHVIDTIVEAAPDSAMSAFVHSIRDGLIAEATNAWKASAARLGSAAADLPCEVLLTNRIVGLLGFVRSSGADLMVLGAYGDRRPDVGFGTVATACVRKSMTDVLLVREGQRGAFANVMVGVDFSATSARALARAAQIAARDGATLHVVHVLSAPWRRWAERALAAPAGTLIPPHVLAAHRQEATQHLEAWAAALRAEHPTVKVITSCLDEWDAKLDAGAVSQAGGGGRSGHRSSLTSYAVRVAADLIVLGTRGRTNLRDVLLGSTAEKVLAESPCSVLAVKPAGFRHPLATGESGLELAGNGG